MDTLPNLGERIVERRESLDMNQGELAEAVGMDQSVLCRIEKNQTRLRVEHLPAFARALRCTMAELLGERPFRKAPTKIAAHG